MITANQSLRYFVGLTIALSMPGCQGGIGEGPSPADEQPVDPPIEYSPGNESIRITVRLDVDFTPLGQLPAEQLAVQQQAIASAQESLIDALSSYNVEVTARFQSIPYLGLSLDQAALGVLLTKVDVDSIREETPVALAMYQSAPLINADKMWRNGWSGAGQAVAVLDTGVDGGHPCRRALETDEIRAARLLSRRVGHPDSLGRRSCRLVKKMGLGG